jgi:hypothetical protein
MKKVFLILVFVLLVFSFAAQAAYIEHRPPFNRDKVVLNVSGNAVSYFDERNGQIYMACSHYSESADFAYTTISSDWLEVPAGEIAGKTLKATFTFGIPAGSLYGSSCGAFLSITKRGVGRMKLSGASGDRTVLEIRGIKPSLKSQSFTAIIGEPLTAGSYYATIELQVAGLTAIGFPATLNSIRLETVPITFTTPPLTPVTR